MEKENLIVFQNSQNTSLQEAFAKFREQKKKEMRNKTFIKKSSALNRDSQEYINQLREKFIARARHYIGVPYAQRFHEPGTEAYNSPIFLDCCGLVRQVMRDLEEDFGFSIGRWNQAYQYDTLPIDLEFGNMKPGDLVFYSATYYDSKKKRQLHDMVHVEIFLGGETGEATVGSRWFKGRVQVFDSYKFTSTNYYNIKHHFKSIDTWLRGICRSHCPEHPWRDDRKNQWVPNNSIFAEQQAQTEYQEVKESVCFVGKGNNRNLVKDCLVARGWCVLPSNFNFDNSYKLKWVQTPGEVDFYSHNQDLQLVNHLPNVSKALCSKKALAKACKQVKVPLSFDLKDKSDLRSFLEEFKERVCIYKPECSNMGRGIQIINNVPEFKQEVPKKGIVQQYIENPLLIEGCKFDIRMFALVAQSSPFIVLKHPLCYGRKCLNKYDLEDSNLLTHLTNAAQQKKHPEYPQRKEETILSETTLQENIDQKEFEHLKFQAFETFKSVFLNRKNEITKRKGCFELIGIDVLVDSNLEHHLLEMNINPALFTDTSTQAVLFPKLIDDTVQVVTALQKGSQNYLEGTLYELLYIDN